MKVNVVSKVERRENEGKIGRSGIGRGKKIEVWIMFKIEIKKGK